jgi:hypothetical protein
MTIGKCPLNPGKFRNSCHNFRNPIPDTTLRANAYYTFRAGHYASTFANATGARSCKKVPGQCDGTGRILEIERSEMIPRVDPNQSLTV